MKKTPVLIVMLTHNDKTAVECGCDILMGTLFFDSVNEFCRQHDLRYMPFCIAGSIDSFQRLDELKEASPWAFTIGGAFFKNKFEGTFCEQIDKACDYMNQ